MYAANNFKDQKQYSSRPSTVMFRETPCTIKMEESWCWKYFWFTLWYILLSVKVDVLNEFVSNPGFILLNSIIDDEFSYPLSSILSSSSCLINIQGYSSGLQGVSLYPVSFRIYRECHCTRYHSGYTVSVIAPGIIQDIQELCQCTRYHSGFQRVSVHLVFFRF